jgi:hypothetical protein
MTKKNHTVNPTRRDFLKEVAGTTAAVGAASGLGAQLSFSQPTVAMETPAKEASPQGAAAARPAGGGRIRLQDNRLQIETSTLTAVIDKGFLTSLKSKATGEEFIKPFDINKSAALQLVYRSDEVVGLDEAKFGSITSRLLSDDRAEVVFHSWDGDGVIAIDIDPESGDLIIEPSAYSSRPGVLACRWNLKGLREDYELVAPFYQGIKMKLDDVLIRDRRWTWPKFWEAGVAILQARSSGFWVHSQDNRYHYKALKVGDKTDAYFLGLDSEAYGPIDDNLSAGSVPWRINVYQGDWKVPLSRYRDWYWRAYKLQAQERRRPECLSKLKFALSWCPGDPEVLDALAKRFDPRTVLLHFSNWRTDRYDQNYPNFVASESARKFMAKGREMGFHIGPHCNSIDMDPTHPVYELVRDFQYRDIETKKLAGWVSGRSRIPGSFVPESNDSRQKHQDKNVMVKIHAGLSMWRSILGENILKAANDLSLEAVFIDVTLNAYNLHNCLVEAMTPSEGMKILIDHVASLGKGLAVGGEGCNEIIAQGQSFAQAHLFRNVQGTQDGLERAGGCAFNEFLHGKLCRTIGYTGLSGAKPDEELRIRIHEEHGIIPTLTIRSASEITNPNPVAKAVFDRAGSR